MVKTRKHLVWGFSISLVSATLIVLWILLHMPGPTRINFGKIELGMTEKQVEQLLGSSSCGLIIAPKQATGYYRYYSGNDCGIYVYFDQNGEVEDMEFMEDFNSSWYHKLIRLLGL